MSLSREQAEWLGRPFELEEIRADVFLLAPDKALGTDVFTVLFSKNVKILSNRI